jgi:uncharacterized RDD family membrane protein YckC
MFDWGIQSVLNVTLLVLVLALVRAAGRGANLFAAPTPMEAEQAALGGLTFLLQIGVQCAYEVWFLTARGGTPGKLMLRLQVLDRRGNRLGRKQAMERSLVYFVTYLALGILATGAGAGLNPSTPFLLLPCMVLGFGSLLPLFDREKRALHDMLANTRVRKQ